MASQTLPRFASSQAAIRSSIRHADDQCLTRRKTSPEQRQARQAAKLTGAIRRDQEKSQPEQYLRPETCECGIKACSRRVDIPPRRVTGIPLPVHRCCTLYAIAKVQLTRREWRKAARVASQTSTAEYSSMLCQACLDNREIAR